MIAEVNASEFRQNAAELLSQVQSQQDTVLIRENGEPIAALVDVALYRRLIWEQIHDLTAPIRAAYQDVPEEAGMAEIDELVRSVRHP